MVNSVPNDSEDNSITRRGNSDDEVVRDGDDTGSAQIIKTEDLGNGIEVLSEVNPAKRSESETSDGNNNNSNNNHGIAGNSKKKRRTLSCLSCRKLKTRCDFEVENGKCHRCVKLWLDCSLTKEYNIDPSQIHKAKSASIQEHGEGLNIIGNRLNAVENNIGHLNSKLDSLLTLLGSRREGRVPSFGSTGSAIQEEDQAMAFASNPYTRKASMSYLPAAAGLAGTQSNGADNYLDKYVSEAPLNIIKQIDSTLFNRVNKYDPLEKACEEFLQFYFNNEALCLQLAKSFLETSHFWIIPGGLKELNREYVTEHPFTTCVFVILAMCFDENYNYVEEQEQLYWLTTKLLGIALITDPLTDHDIEALVYLSLYNIARKPKQPQVDSWILSGTAIKHFLLSMDFTAIKNRILYLREFDSDDLFHLRIWNSLCACHFQSALLSGKPVLISRDYFDIHVLTLKFPRATIGDAIKVSELSLDVKFLELLENSREYFNRLSFPSEYSESFLLKFKELDDWKVKWEHLIKKDISGILLFAYDTYHVILCRRFISVLHEGQNDSRTEALLSYAYKTACKHSFVILERLLKLPASLIRGSPSSSLAQIVYASLTLCDFLHVMNLEDKSIALSLISKIYWHLNYIGEKMNDATDTVGKIIKSIVETASKTADTAARKVEMTATTVTKSPNDTVYDPTKAANNERRLSFNNSPANPTAPIITAPGQTSAPASSQAASTKIASPADSQVSASSYSKSNNFYSGTLKSLHLSHISPANSIASPDTFLKKDGTNAKKPGDGTTPLTNSKTSPFDFDSVQIPDVSQFSTFEDFFNGVFSDFNGDFSNANGSRLETPKLTAIGDKNGPSRIGKINNEQG